MINDTVAGYIDAVHDYQAARATFEKERDMVGRERQKAACAAQVQLTAETVLYNFANMVTECRAKGLLENT